MVKREILKNVVLLFISLNSCNSSNKSLIVDFGEIYPSQELKKNIDITGYFHTSTPFVINKTCNCTAARIESAGDVHILSVTLTATKEIGPFTQSIKITDDENNVLSIFLRAVVVKVWDISPSETVVLKDIPSKENSKVNLVITNLKKENVSILSIDYEEKALQIETEKLDPNSHLITFLIKPEINTVKIVDEILLHTDSSKQPIIKLNLFATVRGIIYPDGDQIFFGTMTPGQSINKKIIIRSDSLQEFSIEKIDVSLNEISCILNKKSGNKYEINFTFSPFVRKGFITGRILIYTNIADQPVIVVPFSAMII